MIWFQLHFTLVVLDFYASLLKNVLLPLLKYTVDLQCIPTILFVMFANILKFVEESQQCTVMADMGS